jgi:serine phosphatase RsbU (regulator of sigma subunit)
MEHLGGDFYDYIQIDENNLGIFLSDVSGHGVSAAFITSMIKSNLDMETSDLLSPAEFFTKLQKKMLPILTDKYFTAIYGVLNKQTGTFTYSNAAHIPQLVYRYQTDSVEKISLPSAFIGLYQPYDEKYEQKCLQLYPGDRLILFTDGFVDNFSIGCNDKSESLKLDDIYKNIKKYIASHKNIKASKFLQKLLEGAQKAHGKQSFSDDIALLMIEMQLKKQ